MTWHPKVHYTFVYANFAAGQLNCWDFRSKSTQKYPENHLNRFHQPWYSKTSKRPLRRRLLKACKQWQLECGCISICSFVRAGRHFLIRRWDKNSTISFSLHLIWHRSTSQLAKERWHIKCVTDSLNWQWRDLMACNDSNRSSNHLFL